MRNAQCGTVRCGNAWFPMHARETTHQLGRRNRTPDISLRERKHNSKRQSIFGTQRTKSTDPIRNLDQYKILTLFGASTTASRSNGISSTESLRHALILCWINHEDQRATHAEMASHGFLWVFTTWEKVFTRVVIETQHSSHSATRHLKQLWFRRYPESVF